MQWGEREIKEFKKLWGARRSISTICRELNCTRAEVFKKAYELEVTGQLGTKPIKRIAPEKTLAELTTAKPKKLANEYLKSDCKSFENALIAAGYTPYQSKNLYGTIHPHPIHNFPERKLP